MSGASKNAVAKLNVLFRDRVHYCDLAETPVRGTSLTAFTVAVSVSGRHHVGVAKTKKAARNAAAERALGALGLWTDGDQFAKAVATAEVDEDPVQTVYRIRDAVARQRRGHAGWGRPQWGGADEPRGRVAPGWGAPGRPPGPAAAGWREDRGWGGPPPGPAPGGWSDRGPGARGGPGARPGRCGGAFDGRRGHGRPGFPRGRGFHGGGGGIPEPFRQKPHALDTDLRGAWPEVGGDVEWSGRAHAMIKATEREPVGPAQTPAVSPLPSQLHSPMTPGPPAMPLAQFPSDPGRFSTPPSTTSSLWSYAVGQAPGIYQPSANQNQAGLPASGYLPSGSLFPADGLAPAPTFSGYYGGGGGGFVVQPLSHDQSTPASASVPTYASYEATAYNWVYNQGSYTPY